MILSLVVVADRDVKTQRVLTALRKKGMAKWDANDCLSWLEAAGFGEYRALFAKVLVVCLPFVFVLR